MSTDTISPSPIGFTVYSIIASGLAFIVTVLYALPALLLGYSLSKTWLLTAGIFLIAFSIAKAHDIAKRHDLYDVEAEISRKWKTLGFIINFIYINIVVSFAMIIGVGVVRVFGLEPGLFIVSILLPVYGFWEIETRARGLPISIGGALVWFIAIVFLAWQGVHILSKWVHRAGRSELKSHLNESRRNILRVMGISEESPIHSTANRYSR
jgi:hypothetical protein